MSTMVDLDTPLLQLSPHDHFTLRDACQGVLITGGIGSGKTSGSGKALAGAYLRAGFGGLILCAKPEEAVLWRSYVKAHGRMKSLIEFDGTNGGFNFIAYEMARHGSAGLNSVVECLMRILEMARAAGPTPGRGGDHFWEDTTRQLLRNSIPVLFAAAGTVSVADLLAFVRSAPRSAEEMTNPDWQGSAFFFACFMDAAKALDDSTGARVMGYWQRDFATLDAKTRGNIIISLTTTLDRFNHGWLRDAFCGQTSMVPELSFHGAIILLDMPALTKNEDGIIAQQLFKYLWQRAVLARNGLAVKHQTRPVFLWADEAQYFINSYDAEFLSTARGSRACTVFLSQSLPTFYAKIGGENAHDRVHHLLGNFATRIWHNNACAETNEWAARTLGKALQTRHSYSEGEGTNTSHGMNMGEGSNWGTSSNSGGSVSHGSNGQTTYGASWGGGSSSGGNDNWGRNRGGGTSSNTSRGYNEAMDYILEPAEFSRMLKTGGPAHANRVSAVWYQAGRAFKASSSNALLAEFAQ
jgi:TraM recognition site of TraD and TraG